MCIERALARGTGGHNEAELCGVRLRLIIQHCQVEFVRADFNGGRVDRERRNRSVSVRKYCAGM